jgi:hypothetical protein
MGTRLIVLSFSWPGLDAQQHKGNNMKMKLVLMGCVLALVAGCKVAVILVEGGEVQSTASGTCMTDGSGEGKVCIHEVSSTSYSESFTAVPSVGWHFVKWNSGGGFLCADATAPTCDVSDVSLAGNPAAEAVVASEQTFYIMPMFEEGAWYPDYETSWSDATCVYGIYSNRPAFATNLECCDSAYAGQMSGACLMDAGAGWRPDASLPSAEGLCVFAVDPNSPGYATNLECCNNAYQDQTSGACLAAAGAAWSPNYEVSWSDATCVYGIYSDRPEYATNLECCNVAYAGQMSGACLADAQ